MRALINIGGTRETKINATESCCATHKRTITRDAMGGVGERATEVAQPKLCLAENASDG